MFITSILNKFAALENLEILDLSNNNYEVQGNGSVCNLFRHKDSSIPLPIKYFILMNNYFIKLENNHLVHHRLWADFSIEEVENSKSWF